MPTPESQLVSDIYLQKTLEIGSLFLNIPKTRGTPEQTKFVSVVSTFWQARPKATSEPSTSDARQLISCSLFVTFSHPSIHFARKHIRIHNPDSSESHTCELLLRH